MWNAVKYGMASVVIALAIVLAGVVGHTIGDNGGNGGTTVVHDTNGSSTADNYDLLNEIEGILHEDFVNPDAVDHKVLETGAINGIIKSLGDTHTVYISPEDYATGIDLISGAFEGIGAQVDQDPVTGEIVIVAPFRDSPAEKAGIQPGDVLLAVDGESTEGWSVSDAVKRIRGPQGTEITLKVRTSEGETKDVTITRDTITIPTVFTQEVKDQNGAAVSDLAYIEIQQFTDQTVNDLRDALKGITDAGYKGLILDLRRNPGGGLDATVQVADMFLDGGVVLTQVDRDGKETVYNAHSGGEALDIPMVILVGPGSASGSEVLSGALRDHGRAKLLGEVTFGKGSVNHVRELSNGGALYVTIARWKTPNGELIEGVGLTPDIPVSFTQEDIDAKRDVQLFAAISELRTNVAQAAP
jgi:carboxyl-terminal processing protease